MDTNAELIARALEDDQGAWRELVGRFDRLVWSVPRSFRLTRADAADVYQSTWLGLAENLSRIREPEKLGAWLITTATRHAIRVTELRGREEPLDRWEPVSHEPGPEEVVLTNDRHNTLWRTFSSLDERCRTILRLAAYAPQLTYADIARAVGMPTGNLGSTRSRCLTVLRRRMLLREAVR